MEDIASGLIGIVLGAAVLLFGKDLRVFGAATGFLIGFTVARHVAPEAFPIAFIAGVIPAVVTAILLPLVILIVVLMAGGTARLILQVIGTVAGAAILLWIGQSLGVPTGVASWGAAFVGALIGFGLMAYFFELGVIILASLLGTSLIVNGLGLLIALPNAIKLLMALGLFVIGFFCQRRH